MPVRRVAIVPHTHWDREWYGSFQDFRLNLVDLFDALLPLLESDDGYAHFMLDGQTAVVDDYLEIRPEAEDRLRALASAGRISMGPWYILMDEFLASGETIIRNLQMGLLRGSAFGGSMAVGYLPDMFGHIAQMPQILRQAGFTDAVVWRGVPSAITRTGFIWEAPDGSAVRAEYLPDGYGNGAVLPEDAKALVQRTADLFEETGDWLLGDLLCMNGSDHL
jgi:alpha-mannosidase